MQFRFRYLLTFLLLVLILSPLSAQQNLTTPRISPYAQVIQTVGLTDIIVTYHRPGVNGRVIWGELVPYGQVWRAGANENTAFEVTDDININGNILPAGSYGLHILPEEGDWTVIFSNVDYAWGSFSYDKTEDAARILVKPENAPFCERLLYYFENLTENSVDLIMRWEKVQISIPIEVNVHSIVFENMRRELRGLPRFFWQSWNQAANYCLQNNINLDEAMDLIDHALGMNGGQNFSNYRVKADLLKKEGRQKEADELMETAFQIASEFELNNYGYQLLFANKTDDAIKIFKMNTERYPDSWNTYDSLAEAYDSAGNKEQAIELYSKALNMTEDADQKTRIKNILKRLKSK